MGVRTPQLPASGNVLLPGQPTNLVPRLSRLSPRVKQSSSTPEQRLSSTRSKRRLRSAPREIPSTCPRARRGAPDPAPAYFAAVAHAEEVIPQHLHGASPGGVDECPSEDVRQGRHRGGTHVSGGAQRGVREPRRAHRAEVRRAVPATCGLLPGAPGQASYCPPLFRATACPLQAAPRGGLPASSMPIGFSSCDLAPRSLGVWSFSPPLC